VRYICYTEFCTIATIKVSDLQKLRKKYHEIRDVFQMIDIRLKKGLVADIDIFRFPEKLTKIVTFDSN
jgi:hypothetical protein